MSEKTSGADAYNVKLANVRLSFPNLDKPVAFGENKNDTPPKYSAHLIIDPDTREGERALNDIDDAVHDVIQETWRGKIKLGDDKLPLKNGNDKMDSNDRVWEGYENKYYLSATANEGYQPKLIYRKEYVTDDLEIRRIFYAGCRVNAIVRIWAQNNSFGKRVNCSLLGLEFYKDDKAFATHSSVDVSDFDFNNPDPNEGDSFDRMVDSRVRGSRRGEPDANESRGGRSRRSEPDRGFSNKPMGRADQERDEEYYNERNTREREYRNERDRGSSRGNRDDRDDRDYRNDRDDRDDRDRRYDRDDRDDRDRDYRHDDRNSRDRDDREEPERPSSRRSRRDDDEIKL